MLHHRARRVKTTTPSSYHSPTPNPTALYAQQTPELDDAIQHLDSADWETIRRDIFMLKALGRARCPACARWFQHPKFFGFVADGEWIRVYATCPSCTATGQSGQRGRTLLMRKIQRFFEGAA